MSGGRVVGGWDSSGGSATCQIAATLQKDEEETTAPEVVISLHRAVNLAISALQGRLVGVEGVGVVMMVGVVVGRRKEKHEGCQMAY